MFFYSKKFLISIIIVLFLLLVLTYIVNINSIPENMILFNDSKLALETIAGIKVKQVESKEEDQTSKELTDKQNNTNERVCRVKGKKIQYFFFRN